MPHNAHPRGHTSPSHHVVYLRDVQCTHAPAQTQLLNGSATCNMAMGRWEEAESQLQEAFEKDAKTAETLANLVTISLHQGKPASRYLK